MRISDWSSDVCSSDLRAQARAQVVQERQFRKDAHPEMREARARLAALDDQAEGMANTIRASFKEQFDVAVHGEKQIQSEIAKVERQAQAERGRGVQMSILERQVDRSEEHTSELQSLMRISYAVFCLKKKNKQ